MSTRSSSLNDALDSPSDARSSSFPSHRSQSNALPPPSSESEASFSPVQPGLDPQTPSNQRGSTASTRPQATNLTPYRNVTRASFVPWSAGKRVDDRYPDIADEMKHQVIGPMKPKEFLQTFLSPQSSTVSTEEGWAQSTQSEAEPRIKFPASDQNIDERQWVEAIDSSGICTQLQFRVTKDVHIAVQESPDVTSYWKPDVVAYDSANGEKSKDDNDVQDAFEKAGFIIEFKREEEDFFDDKKGRVKSTDDGRKTLGQIATYSMNQAWAQPRTHVFSVIIFPRHARLLRWDRSGLIVTERFEWRDGVTLSDFFKRFEGLTPEQRGMDTSAKLTDANDANVEDAASAMKDAGYGHLARAPWYTYTVYDDTPYCSEQGATASAPRHFVAGRPVVYPNHSFMGRSTFGFIAWDIEKKELVYMKDTWRKSDGDIRKEGDVYRTLNSPTEPVPHIPKCVCAGDVYSSNGSVQRTRTQEYMSAEWVRADSQTKSRLEKEVAQYTHYRLILDKVARPLTKFKSLRELVTVLQDAVEAHKEAYMKHQILHRDISAGNILITTDGRGLLIDWELAQDESLGIPSGRRWRTGTWYFMSVANLKGIPKEHKPRDDLQSILWVLLYMVLRFHPCPNLTQEVANDALTSIFDEYIPPRDDTPAKGGNVKTVFLHSANSVSDQSSDFGFLLAFPKPIRELLKALADIFTPVTIDDRYASDQTIAARALTADADKVYEATLILFSDALKRDDWPALGSDPAKDQIKRLKGAAKNMPDGLPSSLTSGQRTDSSRKRSRTKAELGDEEEDDLQQTPTKSLKTSRLSLRSKTSRQSEQQQASGSPSV